MESPRIYFYYCNYLYYIIVEQQITNFENIMYTILKKSYT